MADVSYLLNEAEDAVSDRQWDTAIEKLQKVLQLDPQNEEACERLAKCFAVRGLITQVINQYFTLMDILESKGDFDLSVEVGNWILKLQPENDKARMRMILIHRRKGDTVEVVRQSLALARVYMELNQGDQSILLLQEVAQNDPNNLEIGMELAEMYINQGLIQDGAMQLGKIANMLLEQGQLEKAAEAFRRMKLVTAEDPGLSFTLGNIYVSLGKLNEAEAEFRQILRHNLNHLDALTALGGVCQQKGQFRDAMLAFNKILSIDPQQVVAKEKLGELYQAQGNLTESIKQYLAAAQQHQTSGNTPRSVTLYQRVVSLDPTNPTATRELGNMGAPMQGTGEEAPGPSPFATFAQAPPPSEPSYPEAYPASVAPPPPQPPSRSIPMPGHMSPSSTQDTLPVVPHPPMAPTAPPPEPAFAMPPPAPAGDPFSGYPGGGGSYSQGHSFESMTEPLPPLPEPPGPTETPTVAQVGYWPEPAAPPPEPPTYSSPPPPEPSATTARTVRKRSTGQLPAPSATKSRASASLVRKPGLDRTSKVGQKPFGKRDSGARPALPERQTEKPSLGEVKSLRDTAPPEPVIAPPEPAGVGWPAEPAAGAAWPAEPSPSGWPGAPEPATCASPWSAEPSSSPWAAPPSGPAWPAEPPPVETAPPPPSAFDDLPAPPSFETDGDGSTLVPARAAALAPPEAPFTSDFPTIPVMPAEPPLAEAPPPLAWEPPIAAPPPEPPLAPPAPARPAASENTITTVKPGSARPSLFAAKTQHLEISQEVAEALVRELSQPKKPAAEPPLAMGAPLAEVPLAMPAPSVEPPAATPLAMPAPEPAPVPSIRELPPPQPPLLSPMTLRPGDAPLLVPGGDDAPVTPTLDAVDVTRLHDYIANHDLSRAFAAFHKGLESAPANRELRQHLAQTYFQNGMLEEALGEFENLVDADPQNVRYRQQLAESSLWTVDVNRSVKNMLGYANCLQKEGSFDEAVAVLEDCVALDPGSSRARLALADLHLQLNLPNLALYHLNTLSDIALQREDSEGTLATLGRLHSMTGDPVYQQRLASALVKFGRPEEALVQYRELALKARQRGDMHTSLHGWQQILQVEPEHEEALENLTELYRALGDGEHFLATVSVLARVCRQKGKQDRAGTLLETILSVDPRRMDVRKDLVEVYLDLHNLQSAAHEAHTFIEAAMQSRDYPSAIELLGRLSTADPENLSWREQMVGVYELMGSTEQVLAERLALGQAYSGRGQAEDAIKTYQKALAIDENNAEIHYLLGNLFMEARQDLAAAEIEYQRVLDLDPQHGESLKRMVNLLMTRDEPAHAIAVLNRLIEVAPENKIMREQFLADYQRRIEAAPDDSKSRFILGVLYLELNQHDKAIEQFQKTRPIKPFTLRSYTMLGVAFSRKAGLNSDDLAIKQFKKGLELQGYPEGELQELKWHLGSVLERKGRKAEALDAYKDIYADDVNYRQGELARRMRQLQEELEKTTQI